MPRCVPRCVPRCLPCPHPARRCKVDWSLGQPAQHLQQLPHGRHRRPLAHSVERNTTQLVDVLPELQPRAPAIAREAHRLSSITNGLLAWKDPKVGTEQSSPSLPATPRLAAQHRSAAHRIASSACLLTGRSTAGPTQACLTCLPSVVGRQARISPRDSQTTSSGCPARHSVFPVSFGPLSSLHVGLLSTPPLHAVPCRCRCLLPFPSSHLLFCNFFIFAICCMGDQLLIPVQLSGAPRRLNPPPLLAIAIGSGSPVINRQDGSDNQLAPLGHAHRDILCCRQRLVVC